MGEPAIAERVRFWEEQQRINSLLVPRVVELTKLLQGMTNSIEELRTTVVRGESDRRERTAKLERRMAVFSADAAKKISGAEKDLHTSIRGVERELRDRMATMERRMAAFSTEATAQVAIVEAHANALASSVASVRVSRKLAILAVAVAGVALTLSLVGVFAQ